ncbi:MAG: OmpA family protein, partial [Bacteroidales bacterium]
KVLSKLAANLQNFPETDVTIVGYASHTGNAEDNLDLSMQRAQNVMDYLVKQGVDATRMKAIGKGWTNPVATNMTAAGRADNRRVEIWITPNQQMIDEAQ